MIIIRNRQIAISESERKIGYAGDHLTKTLEFYVLDPLSANFSFKLDLRHTDGSTDIIDLEKEVKPDQVILRWSIEKQQIPVEETLYTQIRAFSDSGEIWHTNILLLTVENSINAQNYIVSPLPSEFEQIEHKITKAKEETAAIAVKTPYIGENGSWYVAQQDGTFQDSGVKAQGAQGPKGDTEAVDYSNLYQKQQVNNCFANAFTKTAGGTAVSLNDVQAETNFHSLLINGMTTQTGTGDKSADTPYTLTALQNPSIKICGKNLCDISYAEAKGYITQNADGTLTLTGATTLYNASIFTQEVGNSGNRTVSRLPMLKPNTTYTLKFGALNGSLATTALYDANGVLNKIVSTALSVTNTFTTTSAGVYLDIRIVNPGTKVTVDYIMLSDAQTAVYEPYSGTAYPISFTGYSLPDGLCDTFDAVTGMRTNRIGKIVLNGTESWGCDAATVETAMAYFDTGTFDNAIYPALHTGYCDKIGNQQILNAASNTGGKETIQIGNISTSRLRIFILKSRLTGWADNWTTSQKTDAFKAWLANNPITVLYKSAVPVTVQQSPLQIPACAPVTNVFIDKSTFSFNYSRDTNAILKKLTAAINALGGSIDL